MPRPEPGKKYLIVFCKSCNKGFRVIDEPLFEGKEHKVEGPLELKCRGCGHVATYQTAEMRVAGLGPKPERPFKSPHGF
jgi:hypothetical protein